MTFSPWKLGIKLDFFLTVPLFSNPYTLLQQKNNNKTKHTEKHFYSFFSKKCIIIWQRMKIKINIIRNKTVLGSLMCKYLVVKLSEWLKGEKKKKKKNCPTMSAWHYKELPVPQLPPFCFCFPWSYWAYLTSRSLPGDEGLVGFLGVAAECGPSCYLWGRGDGDHTYPENIPNIRT